MRYPDTEKWVEKTRRSRVFLNQLRSVWISDETLFRVFDIASQSINDSMRNPKQKLPNVMIIRVTYPNLFEGSDFLSFILFHELLMNLRNLFPK